MWLSIGERRSRGFLKGRADQTEKLSSNQAIEIDKRLWYRIWSRGGTEKAYGR